MMKRISGAAVLLLCAGAAHAQPNEQQGFWENWFWFGEDPQGADADKGIHLIHIRDGAEVRIVAITSESYLNDRVWTPPPVGSAPGYAGVFATYQWATDMFCAGHSVLADGRALIVGGFSTANANTFDPLTNTWTALPDMSRKRYYPTSTTLPSGQVLVTSGRDGAFGGDVEIPELLDPDAITWTQLFSAQRLQPLYPWMFVLPDGNLIDAGPAPDARILESSTWTWTPVPLPNPVWPVPPPPPPGDGGSAVMYEPGKVMKSGGRDPGVATTYMVDLNGADLSNPPAWLVAGDMNVARRNHNLVIFPDGKVLAVGGNTDENQVGAVFEAEIFDPSSGAWSLQPKSDTNHPRKYHSTALLLPDGRVVSAGGDQPQPTAQIFNPPYIASEAPRPIIMGNAQNMPYGESYTIIYDRNGGPEVTQVCLIRPGSVTHSFDQDQRRVPLTIESWGEVPGGPYYYVTVGAPQDGNFAPPGTYMLFILNEYARNQFAPCEKAEYIRVP